MPTNDNDLILARMRGLPAQPGTPETDSDPRNPNVRPIQSEGEKRLHDEWRAETDWRLKFLRHPDLGLSLQRVILDARLSNAGEAVASYLRQELFSDAQAQKIRAIQES